MQAGNFNYRRVADLPSVIPVFPLPAALLLPGGRMPLNIFEPRYLQMVDATMAGDRLIGIIQPATNDPSDEEESPRGPVRIDPETRDWIQNVYVRRVEADAAGKFYNKEIQVFPLQPDYGRATVPVPTLETVQPKPLP